MKNLIGSLLMLCGMVTSFAQLAPPAASVTEVQAATNKYKYVTPYTLGQVGISGGNATTLGGVPSSAFQTNGGAFSGSFTGNGSGLTNGNLANMKGGYFSVTQFGAVDNTNIDSAAAFQAAIVAAGANGVVLIPPTTNGFKIGTGLWLSNSVTIRGMLGTISSSFLPNVYFTHTGGTLFTVTNLDIEGITIENVFFSGPGTNDGSYGFYCVPASLSHNAVNMNGVGWVNFQTCLYGRDTGSVKLDRTGTYGSDVFMDWDGATSVSCEFKRSGGGTKANRGFVFGQGHYTLRHMDSGFGSNSIVMTSGNSVVKLEDCHFEPHSTCPVILATGGLLEVEGGNSFGAQVCLDCSNTVVILKAWAPSADTNGVHIVCRDWAPRIYGGADQQNITISNAIMHTLSHPSLLDVEWADSGRLAMDKTETNRWRDQFYSFRTDSDWDAEYVVVSTNRGNGLYPSGVMVVDRLQYAKDLAGKVVLTTNTLNSQVKISGGTTLSGFSNLLFLVYGTQANVPTGPGIRFAVGMTGDPYYTNCLTGRISADNACVAPGYDSYSVMHFFVNASAGYSVAALQNETEILALAGSNATVFVSGQLAITNSTIRKVSMGTFCSSNNDLYWVTPAKTNLVSSGN
jgi:hypothetical protein